MSRCISMVPDFVLVTGMGPLIGGLNLFHVVASYNGMF